MSPGSPPWAEASAKPIQIGRKAARWDQRYREGSDGWELGRQAPPLEHFMRADPRRPLPPGRVVVPGCGRGHEARLLAELGFEAIGLDFSAEAIAHARQLHGADRPELRWLQADLLDATALKSAGLAAGSIQGLPEHDNEWLGLWQRP